MLSLYIHIPFCDKRCSYCNFFIAPLHDFDDGKNYMDKYFDSLLNEIISRSDKLPNEEIRTIYFGGGTPLCIGKDRIMKIIDLIKHRFNLESLEEISFELNPDPYDMVFDFIDSINKRYNDFFRIRYSIGIQSFDDDILRSSNRGYIFNNIVLFLRKLTAYKNINKMKFFNDFINSGFADSMSLYMLELFPGSVMFDNNKQDEESIYKEFDVLKNLIYDAGYRRYEISNFAFAGKGSIHNRVYWDMGNYIGIGMGASGFLDNEYAKKVGLSQDIDDIKGVRYTNTKSWKDYFDGNYLDNKSIIRLDDKDYHIEKFFLGLRTDMGISDLKRYENILKKDYMKKIQEYQDGGFMVYDEDRLSFTDKGFDVYNDLITNLLV